MVVSLTRFSSLRLSYMFLALTQSSSVLFAYSHDVWKLRRLEPTVFRHFSGVIVMRRNHVVHEVVVLSSDHVHVSSRNHTWSGKSLQSILTINSIAALLDHLCTYTCPSIWSSSVWEQNLINFKKSPLVVNKQI